MLEDFALETFAERVGEVFLIRLDDGTSLELQLASATAAPTRPSEGSRHRAPFSVVFHGPLEPVLPQRIYAFDNDALGRLDLFIVPIGPVGDAMQYEAVFA